jgi:hypothetical protein
MLLELLKDGFSMNGTRGVFDHKTTVRNLIFVALDETIHGFREPRLKYLRLKRQAENSQTQDNQERELGKLAKKLCELLHVHILDKDGGGSEFIARTNLTSITANRRAFLDKTDSFGSLLRFALPGLIDQDLPGRIRPHHIEHDHLNDPKYCKRLFLRTLYETAPEEFIGYVKALDKSTKPADRKAAVHALCKAIRERILKRGEGGGDEWLKENRIYSLISREKLNLETASFGGLVKRFIPNLISIKDPEALQPHEVRHGCWEDKRYARTQLLRAFAQHVKSDAIKGFIRDARKGGAITPESRNKAYEDAIRPTTRTFLAQSGLQSLHIRPPQFLTANATANIEDLARFCFKPTKPKS